MGVKPRLSLSSFKLLLLHDKVFVGGSAGEEGREHHPLNPKSQIDIKKNYKKIIPSEVSLVGGALSWRPRWKSAGPKGRPGSEEVQLWVFWVWQYFDFRTRPHNQELDWCLLFGAFLSSTLCCLGTKEGWGDEHGKKKQRKAMGLIPGRDVGPILGQDKTQRSHICHSFSLPSGQLRVKNLLSVSFADWLRVERNKGGLQLL